MTESAPIRAARFTTPHGYVATRVVMPPVRSGGRWSIVTLWEFSDGRPNVRSRKFYKSEEKALGELALGVFTAPDVLGSRSTAILTQEAGAALIEAAIRKPTAPAATAPAATAPAATAPAATAPAASTDATAEQLNALIDEASRAASAADEALRVAERAVTAAKGASDLAHRTLSKLLSMVERMNATH